MDKNSRIGLVGLFVIFIFLAGSCDNDHRLEVLDATSKSAIVKVDDKVYSTNWIISPDINPDILPIEIEGDHFAKVTFLTDIDSVSYTLNKGDIKDFIVLLNKKDSAFTRLQGVPSKVNFTDSYILENKGKWSVEVNEAQELIQIISVITPTGLADVRSMIINHDTTSYYKSVLNQFLPFKNEPIVKHIDSLLLNNWYLNMKADACALEFDDENNLTKSDIYDRMRGSKNLLDPFIEQLNEFAKKSDFRTFYKNNRSFYQSLIDWQEKEISTKEQWDWLETQFPDYKYDHYRITFSPLVKGNHSTVRFNNNNFNQVIMFIRPPYKVKNVNDEVSNGLITRFVFTEIDHNYVNPETDKYIDDVNSAFSDRAKWTNGKESNGYKTPYAVFNEYMTWSVYLLYCYDKYEYEDFMVINDRIVNYFINRRGFHRFDDFHTTFLDYYKKKSANETVADLYPRILTWAISYEPSNEG